MRHCIFICLLFALFATNGAELYRCDFPDTESLWDKWKAPEWARKELGGKILQESDRGKAILRSKESNLLLFTGDSGWRDYTVALAVERRFPCGVTLLGRLSPVSGNCWALRMEENPRRALSLERRFGGKTEVKAEVPFPADTDARHPVLELRFEGNKVTGLLNGKPLLSAEDDGTLKQGVVGLQGGYWTNLRLLEFKVESSATPEPQSPVPASAPVPKSPKSAARPFRVDWSLDRAEHHIDGMRERLTLNNFWNFLPVESIGNIPEKWGYFLVPGHWQGGNVTNFMRAPDGRRLTQWEGKQVTAYPAAWYRRTFRLPESWAGRTAELYFENLKGRPVLYLNGREVARSKEQDNHWRVDVTDSLKPGENEVLLSLDSSPLPPSIPRSGIFGNVWLECRPRENLGFPRLMPSVSDKELKITFPGAATNRNSVDVRITDADGRELLKRTVSGGQGEVRRIPFLPDRLWTPDTPHLLTAEFTLRDDAGNMIDRCSRKFGFREFTVKNGQFLLNGNPCLLRFDTGVEIYWSPDSVFNENIIRNRIKGFKSLNMNGMYVASDAPDRYWDLLDEAGMLALSKGVMKEHGELTNRTGDENWWGEFESAVRRQIDNPARFNHPSLIGNLIDVWFNFHSGVRNPEYVGMKAEKQERPRFAADGSVERSSFADPNLSGVPLQRKKILDRMAGLYRKYEPDLEIFCGGSGEVGQAYSTHLYHTWGVPESEMRAFFSRWAMNPERPVFGGEICIPYIGSFYEIDTWGSANVPYFAENAARTLGPAAYRYTPVRTRRPFHNTGKDSVISPLSVDNGTFPRLAYPADVYNDALAASTERLFPAWRTAGFQGFGAFEYADRNALLGMLNNVWRPELPENLATTGYKPESFDQYNAGVLHGLTGVKSSPVYFAISAPPLRRAFAPLSFWIAGKAPDFYNDDHAFYGGETVEKQLAVLNDTAETQKIPFRIELRDGEGRILSAVREEVAVPAFSRRFAPVRLTLPRVAERSEFTIAATGGELRDEFRIQAFPETKPEPPLRPLFVFDPEGKLAAWLKSRGIPFTAQPSINAPVPDGALLLVGRRALTLKPGEFDPDRLAERGVRTLVLEQLPEAAPELVRVRSRQAFRYDREHPALAGFEDVDFSLWNGNDALEPPYQPSPAGITWTNFGNRNMVATCVWRRPFAGDVKTLLASGFDLAQSPLIESVKPKGGWISCQLDLTGRLGTAPAATRLFVRLLDYLDRRGEIGGRTLRFGDNTPDRLRIDAQKVDSLDRETLAGADRLLISGPDFSVLEKYQKELTEFVYWGGRIVYLHTGKEFSPRWLPFALELGEEKTDRALLSAPGWNRGWDNPELTWGKPLALPVFRNFNRAWNATDPAVVVNRKFGKGEYWFVSLRPELFGDDYPAAKISRLWSAILIRNGFSGRLPQRPFEAEHLATIETDLTDRKWDFRTDPDDSGLKKNWHSVYRPEGWLNGLIADGREVLLGMPFEAFLSQNYDGVAWYRLNVEFPERLHNEKTLFCTVGAIDDFDEIYLNGVKIGETGRETPKYWEAERVYPIPAGLLKPGKNLIAVRVTDIGGNGGIVKGPFKITNHRPQQKKSWTAPFGGTRRDYEYKADLIRMY